MTARYALLIAFVVGPSVAPAAIAGQQNRTNSEVEQALDRTIALDLKDVPLRQVAELLRERLQIPVLIDEPALRDEGVTPNARLTIRLHGVPARAAVRELIRPLYGAYIVRGGSLVITSGLAAANSLQTRTYSVADLVDRDWRHSRDLIEQIESCVAPSSWESVGGAGTSSYEMARARIVVSQSYSVHRDIEDHLARLREARRVSLGLAAGGTAALPATGSRIGLPAKRALLAQLQQPATCDFNAQPLGKVLDALADQLQLNIVPDRVALEEEGVELNTRVTLRVEKVTYNTALELLLNQLNLTFVERDGVISVTSQPRVANSLVTEFFPIGDLVRSPQEARALEDMFTGTVAPKFVEHCRWDWQCAV